MAVWKEEYGMNSEEVTKQREPKKCPFTVFAMIQPCPAVLPGCTDFIKGLASAEITGSLTVRIEKWDSARISQSQTNVTGAETTSLQESCTLMKNHSKPEFTFKRKSCRGKKKVFHPD